MFRLLGIALFAGVLWAFVELYTGGLHGAFGGSLAAVSAEPALRSERAANAFQRAYDSSETRVDRALKKDEEACADCPRKRRHR